MRKEALTEATRISISEVLETMFFMPVDVVEIGTMPWPAPPLLAVSLSFTGPESGRFVLEAPRALAWEFSSDFLGMDQDQLSESDVLGTVKEMLNMLAGNALSHFNQDAVFTMGLPETVAAGAEQGDNAASLDIRTLGSGMRMVIELD